MAYLFAGYSFDADCGLRYGTQAIALQPKERALLALLLQAEGRIVSKERVAQQIWHGFAVSDESISRAVYRLRQAMQAAGGPPVVGTVYSSGFRLVAPVQCRPDVPDASARRLPADWYLVAGREWMARPAPTDALVARQALVAAVVRAPRSAAVWAALAELEYWQMVRGQQAPVAAALRALEAVERALQIDARYALARGLRGWLRAMAQGAWEAGWADLQSAHACDPQHWLVCHLFAEVMLATGDHAGAMAMAETAHALNPYHPQTAVSLARQRLFGGQPAAAWAAARAATEQFPGVPQVWETASMVLSAHGLWDAAIDATERLLGCAPQALDAQFQRVFLASRRDGPDGVLSAARLLAASDCPAYCVERVWLLLALEQTQPAYGWLQGVRQLRAPHFFSLRHDPRLAPWIASLKGLWLR